MCLLQIRSLPNIIQFVYSFRYMKIGFEKILNNRPEVIIWYLYIIISNLLNYNLLIQHTMADMF